MSNRIAAKPTLNGVRFPNNLDFIYDDGKAKMTFILENEDVLEFFDMIREPVKLGVAFSADDRPRTICPRMFLEITGIDSNIDDWTAIELSGESREGTDLAALRKL
ncbi:hypothetical protein JOC34_002832 [Virgibacillus halotolerans]|uniref:hypothetical protein n=1 Tax=Virgibacillus halotolerans TaxID=1071053 RepID=UPI00195FCFEB|nr:hypothetical protein [Virgibacillus halotolerans]MBM7600441.1 hypothetical protein [Virgibacillus halotolerans]